MFLLRGERSGIVFKYGGFLCKGQYLHVINTSHPYMYFTVFQFIEMTCGVYFQIVFILGYKWTNS